VRVVGYAFRWAIPDVQVQKVENGYITVQSPTNGRCVRALPGKVVRRRSVDARGISTTTNKQK
jgi:hypothetical protein